MSYGFAGDIADVLLSKLDRYRIAQTEMGLLTVETHYKNGPRRIYKLNHKRINRYYAACILAGHAHRLEILGG